MGFELIALFELAALWGCFAAWAASRDWVRLQQWHREWGALAKICVGAEDAPPCPAALDKRRVRLSVRDGDKRSDIAVVATLDLSDQVPDDVVLTRHVVHGEARALLYGPDTETGDARFDALFVLNGPPEPGTVLLAREAARRTLVDAFSDMRFTLRDGVVTLRSTPNDMGLPPDGAVAAFARLGRVLPNLVGVRDVDATLFGVALLDASPRVRRWARMAMPSSAVERFGAVAHDLPEAEPDRFALLRVVLAREPVHGALWEMARTASLDAATRAWLNARATPERTRACPTGALAAPSFANA